jgi:hypothetical protein
MQFSKLIISVFIFTSALTGCERFGSFGVSVDKTRSTSSDQSTSLSSDKSISASNSSRTSIKIAASALIAQSVGEYLNQEGYKPPYRTLFIKAGSGTTLSSHSKEPNATYKAAALAIASSFEPVLSWPSYTTDQAFMIQAAAIANFTNSVATQIAINLQSAALQNPEAAQVQIISALGSIPQETLESLWASSLNKAKNVMMVQNLSGSSSPVEYKASDQLITASANGISISKNGLVWFGGGNLSGKAIDLSMDSSLSTSLNKKLDLNLRQSAGGSESSKVSADIKH